MKPRALTNLGKEELTNILHEKEKELFGIELKHGGDQKQRAKRRLVKRDIARILTMLSQQLRRGDT